MMASQGCVGATLAMEMIWRMAGGARVWTRPMRL